VTAARLRQRRRSALTRFGPEVRSVAHAAAVTTLGPRGLLHESRRSCLRLRYG
jgi:hypothetical protein